MKDTLTHLDIFLGDKCNLKCIHCPCWLNQAPLELPQELLWAKVSEALEYVETHCPSFDKFMLIGGEPFSHAGLPQFLMEQQFDVYLTVYTNFAHEMPAYQWPDNVHFLTSMDAADNETYRKTRRTKDFPTVHENLLRNAPWIIHTDTTVSKLNYDRLDTLLALTEIIDCTHWFLPIDPRLLRYAKDHSDYRPVRKTAEKLEQILLDESVIASVEAFFEEHKDNERINDYSMFHGLYLSGTRHFEDLDTYAVDLKRVGINDLEGCPAGERYLEITFDEQGRFVPVLYCPELIDAYAMRAVPHFNQFGALIDWLDEAFAANPCRQFCGRTQFLGIDEYKDRFSEVQLADQV